MIQNFSDHAANERTFLAWVRTAIAVMAFGFLIERFDLFLEVTVPALAGRSINVHGQEFASIAGFSLIILGAAMVAVAGLRFVLTARDIDRAEMRRGTGSHLDLALAVLLALLGLALALYLSHDLVSKV